MLEAPCWIGRFRNLVAYFGSMHKTDTSRLRDKDDLPRPALPAASPGPVGEPAGASRPRHSENRKFHTRITGKKFKRCSAMERPEGVARVESEFAALPG
jgi:hypothetical protein